MKFFTVTDKEICNELTFVNENVGDSKGLHPNILFDVKRFKRLYVEYNLDSVSILSLAVCTRILSIVLTWFSSLNLHRLSSANQKVIESNQMK